MKRTVIRVLVVMITLVWMLVIFGFSSQSGEESGGLSAAIAGPVTKWLAGLQRGLTTEAEAALFSRVDGVVRMVAHFFESAVLGGLLTLVSQLLSKTDVLVACCSWNAVCIDGRVASVLYTGT